MRGMCTYLVLDTVVRKGIYPLLCAFGGVLSFYHFFLGWHIKNIKTFVAAISFYHEVSGLLFCPPPHSHTLSFIYLMKERVVRPSTWRGQNLMVDCFYMVLLEVASPVVQAAFVQIFSGQIFDGLMKSHFSSCSSLSMCLNVLGSWNKQWGKNR